MSYMAMYIISVHILNSNSKSSVGADHWKLNLDEGKVLQAENEKTAGSSDSHADHLFSILTSTRVENGEWRVDSQIECVHCQHKEHENMEVRYGAVFLFSIHTDTPSVEDYEQMYIVHTEFAGWKPTSNHVNYCRVL